LIYTEPVFNAIPALIIFVKITGIKKMRCPNCKSYNTAVVKTEPLINTRLRLRVCYQCKHVFETIEKLIQPDDKTPKSLFDGKP
jgi:hypothetical protein